MIEKVVNVSFSTENNHCFVTVYINSLAICYKSDHRSWKYKQKVQIFQFFYIIHSVKITFYNHWVLHSFSFTLLCFDVPPSKKDVIILTFQFAVIQMMMLLRCFTSDILIRCSGYEMSTLHVGKLTDMSNNIVYIHDPEFNFDVRW